MKAVLVIWEDAHDEDSPDHWVSAETPTEACYVQTIGFLLQQDRERIVLTSTVSGALVSRRTVIPAGMVRRIIEIDFSPCASGS